MIAGWIPKAIAQESSFYVEAQTGTLRYQSVERNSAGGLLNLETGHLPVQGLQMGYRRGAWTLTGSMSQAGASIDYLGVTQSGLPITTTTDLSIRQSNLSLAYGWPISEGQSAALRVSLKTMALSRQIRPGPFNSPLNEALDSTLVGFGVVYHGAIAVTPSFKAHLSFDTDWQRSVSNSLGLDTLGKYDPVALVPGAFTFTQASISAGFEHSSGVYGGVRLGLQRFAPGSSSAVVLRQNGQAVATASYPGSRQDLRYSGFFLGWKF